MILTGMPLPRLLPCWTILEVTYYLKPVVNFYIRVLFYVQKWL
nr:MAG TPA: hypothetical protein [Crassvirales sp.]